MYLYCTSVRPGRGFPSHVALSEVFLRRIFGSLVEG